MNNPARLSLVVVLLASLTGCVGPFDDDPMLAVNTPAKRLRQIKTFDLEQAQQDETSEAPDEPAPAPAQLELTVEDCRALALKHNLDLKVNLYNPTIADTAVTREQARFEALFGLRAGWAKTDAAVASGLVGSQTENFDFTPSVDVPLRTGGNLRLAVPTNRFETDNAFSTLNPSVTTDFAISVSHELLRNFGRRTNMHGIRIAMYEAQGSRARTKLEVIRVLAAVDRAYWVLDAVRRELEVRKREHDLAMVQLQRVRRQVKAGTQPEVEIIRSETGVAETLEAIIIAENRVRDAQRVLKRILNKPGLPQESPTIIIPATKPAPIELKLNRGLLVSSALGERMEMLELELQLAADHSAIDFARNQALPLASMDYTYNINGLGSNYADSLSVLEDRNFADHRVGLRVEVPIGNEAAESQVRRALLTRLQRLATREQRTAQITQEVLNAIDQIEANWQRLLAARQRAVLAGRNLAAEQRQFGLGMRTSTEVLDAQARLADAQSAEVRAIVDYQIAQVDLAFATGTVLGASLVDWSPTGLEDAAAE